MLGGYPPPRILQPIVNLTRCLTCIQSNELLRIDAETFQSSLGFRKYIPRYAKHMSQVQTYLMQSETFPSFTNLHSETFQSFLIIIYELRQLPVVLKFANGKEADRIFNAMPWDFINKHYPGANVGLISWVVMRILIRQSYSFFLSMGKLRREGGEMILREMFEDFRFQN